MSTLTPSLLPGATRDLAAFASGLEFRHIPRDVVERVKLNILDGLGVCLYGATLPWTRHLREMVLEEGAAPVASVWGTGRRSSLSGAVLVNSTAGHAFEMDDIHKESVVHPNSLAVPVAMALAEVDASLTGTDVLTAIIAGYEVGARVGNAATTALFLNGFHPQGTSGVFVAVVTAARLLRLDAVQTQHALGIAGSMGAGLMAAQEGAMVKRLHGGRAAQSGMYGALLAKRGFTGITDVVEAGYGGFLSSLARIPNPGRLMEGLGTDWEAGKVGFKMYPNVTSIHAALDALRTILLDEHLAPRDIDRVEVGCGHMTFVHTAWPYKPAGVTAAQMNMYYGLAVIALRGTITAMDYAEERIADPGIRSFLSRISITEDPELEARGSAFRHAARVTVRTTDGRTFLREVYDRRGSPENPVTKEEVVAKFRPNAGAVLSESAIRGIEELVAELDGPERLPRLVALMSSPSGDLPT